jgi:hypothetical protein
MSKSKEKILTTAKLERLFLHAYDTLPDDSQLELFPVKLTEINQYEKEIRIRLIQLFNVVIEIIEARAISPFRAYSTIVHLIRLDKIVLPTGYQLKDMDDFWEIIDTVSSKSKTE